MKAFWIILAIAIVLIVLYFVYRSMNNKSCNINLENQRFVVKCVPDCLEDEVCVKGACVKKKITYYN